MLSLFPNEPPRSCTPPRRTGGETVPVCVYIKGETSSSMKQIAGPAWDCCVQHVCFPIFFKESQSSQRNVSVRLPQLSGSSNALPSALTHPWTWPTPLPIDQSAVSSRHLHLRPPPRPPQAHTWRRDCSLRTLAPSCGLGATPWAFPVSWETPYLPLARLTVQENCLQCRNLSGGDFI